MVWFHCGGRVWGQGEDGERAFPERVFAGARRREFHG